LYFIGNLDGESERIIANKIDELFSNVTIISVAHRLLSIANFDRILVLDDGKIIEEGQLFRILVANPSDEEITSKGYFADMVRNCGPATAKEIFKIAKMRYSKIKTY
jgi:ATP-binding cassette, subfamily C (CFTR/MRP), member 4